MSDKPKSKCPECKGKLQKLISLTGFSLKGGGWYKDGYSSPKPEGKSESKASPASSTGASTGASKDTTKESPKTKTPDPKPTKIKKSS